MRFEDPYFLILLLLIPLVWRGVFRRSRAAFKYPLGESLRGRSNPTSQTLLRFVSVLPQILRTAALILFVVALARPQYTQGEKIRSSEGLDILLAIDTSGSMQALDLELNGERKNRLAIVKKVIEEFIVARPDDRIGMVVFGKEAFTQAPLTLDHGVLLKFLERISIGMAGDGTAIGDAIATSTKRVKDIEAKSRIVILLTDGSNTAGTIDPLLAAEAAASFGVKVYTIGVGKEGKIPFPVQGIFGSQLRYIESDLDEELLQNIAQKTEATFFRASDTEALRKVYETIDQLEKTKIDQKEFIQYEELYMSFVFTGLIILLLEVLFSLTSLWRLP